MVRIAQIGPAGEKLVRYACILNDLKYANGRSGLGAVMGSKNLKAIAVRGHNRLEFKDPEKIKEIGKWYSENWPKHPGALSRSKLGTSDGLLATNADGILPTEELRERIIRPRRGHLRGEDEGHDPRRNRGLLRLLDKM